MAGTIEVIVDMYSGRPNPRWPLSDGHIEDLKRRLEESRNQPQEEGPQPPGLGFRGFRIVNPKPEADLPYEVHVYRGTLTVAESPAAPIREQFTDVTGIEGWLMTQAAEQGLGDAIAQMDDPRHR